MRLAECDYDRDVAIVDFDATAPSFNVISQSTPSGSGSGSGSVSISPFCYNCGVSHIRGSPDRGISEWPCSSALIQSSVTKPQTTSNWATLDEIRQTNIASLAFQEALIEVAARFGYFAPSAPHYVQAELPNKYYGAELVHGLMLTIESHANYATGKRVNRRYSLYSPSGSHRTTSFNDSRGSNYIICPLFEMVIQELVSCDRLVIDQLPGTHNHSVWQVLEIDGIRVPPVKKWHKVDGKFPLDGREESLVWYSAIEYMMRHHNMTVVTRTYGQNEQFCETVS